MPINRSQCVDVRSAISDQYGWRAAVLVRASAIGVMEMDAPTNEQERVSLRPDVLEEHCGFRAREHQGDAVAMVG